LPQVLGLLVTGVLLGLVTLIPNQPFITDTSVTGIGFFAEIGVILIMFSAGIETDVKQIKKTGVAAVIITLLGVLVPLGLGFLASFVLPGVTDSAGNIDMTRTMFRNVFYGVILTATSVSVTIAALKELGKLNTKIGTAIVSAAILDDIIGVIILSVILSLDKAATGSGSNASSEIIMVFVKTILFFVFAIGAGLVIRMIFKKLSNKYDHHRRMAIFSLAVAFAYAFIAEYVFGIADITGAFFAGLILSKMKDTEYIEQKTDTSAWLLFTPVFFAKVGLSSMSSFTGGNGMDLTFVIFGITFIFAGIAGKLLGCGLGAKISRYSFKDSFRCGIGMMGRAEVCLISAQKGIDAGIISSSIQPFILVLILLTSFITPVLLKLSYKNDNQNPDLFAQGEEITNVNQGPSLDQ
jgi:Kef-type K+ transport system membrane component KefB